MRLTGILRLVSFGLWLSAGVSVAASAPQAAAPNPDAACRNCHQAIYDSYQSTPMAHASGLATDALLPGAFAHSASGITYRLFLRDGRAWLGYARTNPADGLALDGEQELAYYIGSGKRGRTYLFDREGFWFESPVNWYAKKQLWDMNPKSLNAKEMPLTLPVDSTCLHCHASDVQATLPGARNHFAAAPFLHGGITCEACHGDAAAHLASKGSATILNPAKLSASRRDSVCLQCHLEGEVAVNEPGRSLQMFKPGDELSDNVRFFAHVGERGVNGRATSQWEALLKSACKRKSGERLTCTSCHNPHFSPRPEERVTYYRARCVACHNDAAFLNRHHTENQDCTSCHMARVQTSDVAHEQVTDHRIPRHAASTGTLNDSAEPERLTAIGGLPATERDLGLAYAQFALRGDATAAQQALPLLNEAEKHAGAQTDTDLHMQLGLLLQESGDSKAAAREYQLALAADANNSIAAGNLAVLDASQHRVQDAVRLWRIVAQEDPAQLAAGFNLAIGECMLGDRSAAIYVLQRLLLFSPDDTKARTLLAQLSANDRACAAITRH